ncbi:unnamed protein product [Rotaria socialis]|uniref:Myosin motor domain-containing protein n=1 Tax=Rotaria socialis TaxID=392032 RepID=A0A818GJR1_9BILA|nr:unnamed protein product [Rotaria socialis]
MRTTKQNQPIVVTGESGAGKTESAKYVLQYLSKSYHACNASIKDRLIKSNLLLEAFGNTKTIHNNNSSRFGEIMEVHFDEEYTIVGGSITYYLFEKTRVCVQSTDEKNFHIFYYLCVDAPARIRKSLQLNSPDTYHHLNQDCSQTKQLTKSYPQDTDFKCEQLVSNLKLNDTNDFIKYDQIMNDIAISQEDKLNIYSILAGILHLGNINFEDDSESTQNGCKIISTSEQALIVTAQMLHVDVHDLWNVILARISMMKNTIISVPLTVHTAEHVRDKLAKTIYARLFNQLVAYVNTSISFKSSTSHISIIDTIGFENYPINSFEQFCINYCNEKIQQVFNEHLFETARLLFEEEGIGLNKIDYTDNQDCINLFEDQITGWFHLLDEESNVTEQQSNQSTHDIFHGNPNHSMISPKLDLPAASIIHHNEVFLVEHYSGNAVYSTSEFIDKNNDILLDSFIIFVRKSKNEFVKNLFDEIFVEQSKDNINYLSVGTKVRSEMTDIINKVKGSVVHFITCIKPNVKMISNEFQQDQIRSQLKKLDLFNDDDEMMMMNETAATLNSSSKINILQEINSLPMVDNETHVFNDLCDEQLSFTRNDSQPIWCLFNGTGNDLIVDYLGGFEEFDGNISSTSINIKHNEFIQLLVKYQLSAKIGDVVKTINLNRSCKRVYDLSPSTNQNRPIQMLCDVQIRNDRRHVIFRSLVKIYNNTTVPLSVISVDLVATEQNHKIATIEDNDQYFVPTDLLYTYSSSQIYIAVHGDENNIETNNCCSIDWENKPTMETTLKLKDGTEVHLTIITELNAAYMENTDQLDHTCFNIYIHPTFCLINLLPIDIKYLFDIDKEIDLKSNQSCSMISANRNSTLTFIIPSYDNARWISDAIDLKLERTNDHYEYLVLFHYATSPNLEKTLRMILRVDTIHKSHRLSLYSSFWIFNYIDLKLELQIENNRTFIDVAQTPVLVCPERFESETNRKGQLRLYGIDQGDTTTDWSEKFSLDVIRRIGVVSCEVPNDRKYMICMDVATGPSSLVKIIEFSPLLVIINKSIIAIEIVEAVSDKEQNQWISVNPEQTIPFWPRNMKDGVMRVRYTFNHVTSSPFTMTPTYRTLLRMDYEEHPALCVEVTTNGQGRITVIFEDYEVDDTPLVNCEKTNSSSL